MSSPPTTLGQYQIIREIARSNDIVYEAYDPLMNRRVAVKELATPQGSTAQQKDDRISRFRREAQAAGTLNHPNIMTVYSFAEDAGRTFMAMEYLDGQSLRNELDVKGTIPVERAVEIVQAVLAGLEHAHSKGVIHRDIKPDNVQILSTGAVKITDFGIARLTFQPNLTMDGQVFGTPSYMSPEQVIGRDIDARSDLFSAGVLLYEMISGQKPFAGDSVVSITYAIMNKVPDRLSTISYPLWQVIEKAVEKTTAMRYHSAAEMSAALTEAMRPQSSGMAMPMALPTGQAPPPVNPYGSAPPVAGANPYAKPNGPITTPYNPYASAAPPPVPGQAPIQFPYNPYAARGGGNAPHTPGMIPPGAIPVYYPPPPRQPLLKAETVAFLKRLAISFLIIGTLAALLLVGVEALVQGVGRLNGQQEQERIRNRLVHIDPNTPVEDQIQQWKQYEAHLPPNVSADEANHSLGALYEREAQHYYDRQDYEHAEDSLQQAIDVDPHNPALFSDLGNLYVQRAQATPQTNYSDRAKLYGQGSEAFNKAVSQETDPVKRSQEALAVAQNAYRYAVNAQQSGDPEEIRNARLSLESARPFAAGDSTLSQQIEALLNSLRNS